MALVEIPAGFTYVSSARQSRKKRNNTKKHGQEQPSLSELVDRTMITLMATGWCDEFDTSLDGALSDMGSPETNLAISPVECLCLGLGSPSDCRESRAQLSLLIHMCQRLDIPHNRVALYDPAFLEADINFLGEMGFTVLAENKRGRHKLHAPTLVFMPHCGVQLYESILRENWSPEGLSRLLLLTNQLSMYLETVNARTLEEEIPCIVRLASILSSRPLTSCPTFSTSFNSLSLQNLLLDDVLSSRLSSAEFWTLPPISALVSRETDNEVF